LIKLRQRQHCAQLETSRLLLLRDGNGREEGFLDPRDIRWIALEQNVAADAMALRVKPTLSRALAIGDARSTVSSAASISPASTSASASAVAMNGMKLPISWSRQAAIPARISERPASGPCKCRRDHGPRKLP
jgi:hypothetical protein